MATLSIIIVTYNSGDTIISCLNSLPQLVCGAPVEVIVVDNASHDGTAERVRANFPNVRVLSNPDNPGYGVGNNRGFALATGEMIAIINPDVVVRPNALEELVTYLHAYTDVGIVGPKTFDSQHNPVITARHSYTVPRLIAKYLALNRIWPRLVYGTLGSLSLKSAVPLNVDWLHGSALVIPRAVYEQLGGFDPAFFLFMEDVDICMRAKEIGYRVVYLPSAEVEHIGSESVSRFPVTRIRSYHISPLYYFRKRGKPNAVRMLKIAFIVELTAKSFIRRAQNLLKADPRRLEKARIEWKTIRDVWRY